jgi:hypothetical protein
MRHMARPMTHENLKHNVWGRAFSPPVPAKAGTHWMHFELLSEQSLMRHMAHPLTHEKGNYSVRYVLTLNPEPSFLEQPRWKNLA